jgi:hypothetical protein
MINEDNENNKDMVRSNRKMNVLWMSYEAIA